MQAIISILNTPLFQTLVCEYKKKKTFLSFYKNPLEKFSGKWSVFWTYTTVGKGGVDIWKTEGSPNAFYEFNLITMQVLLITKMVNSFQHRTAFHIESSHLIYAAFKWLVSISNAILSCNGVTCNISFVD